MKRNINLLLAAAVVTGGLTFARAEDRPQPAAVDHDKLAPAPAAAALPAGVKAKDAKDDNEDVYDTFESLTRAAVMKGGFDDFVERLVDQDRNRIGNFAEKDFAELDAKVTQIRKAWADKYGGEFEVDDDDFKSVALLRGEIEDSKRVASSWPVAAVTDASGEAVQAAATEAKTSNDDPNLNSNIEKGREVAIATFPSSHGLPPLHVSLIKELQGYRVDAPNTVTGQQLHDNLLKHLTVVADATAHWPADKKDAGLMLTHHVLMAVYGVDAPQQRNVGPADSARPAK